MPKKKKTEEETMEEEDLFDDLFADLEVVEEVRKARRVVGPRKYKHKETGEIITREEYNSLPDEEKEKYEPYRKERTSKKLSPEEIVQKKKDAYEKAKKFVEKLLERAREIKIRTGDKTTVIEGIAVPIEKMAQALVRAELHGEFTKTLGYEHVETGDTISVKEYRELDEEEKEHYRVIKEENANITNVSRALAKVFAEAGYNPFCVRTAPGVVLVDKDDAYEIEVDLPENLSEYEWLAKMRVAKALLWTLPKAREERVMEALKELGVDTEKLEEIVESEYESRRK